MNLSASSHMMTETILENAKYLITGCLNALAQMSMGQGFLRLLDRLLWIIEKTAEWSLPDHELTTEENGKSLKSMELIRPLPWILFLPGVIVLRLFRISWNLGAAALSYPKLEPSHAVKYIQKARRRLRAIKTSGIKSMRQRRAANNRPLEKSLHETKRSLIKSIQLTLSSLSCLDSSKLSPSPPPTRIQVRVNSEMSLTPEEKSATESTIASLRTDSKRKYTQISSDDQQSSETEDETLNSKIDRLAQEDSSDDQDFDPAECSSESSVSNTTDDENEEESLSASEIQDVLRDSRNLLLEQKRRQEANDADDTHKCTADDAKEKRETPFAEEQQDYLSPQEYKSGDDGETAFYSPISSKSASPERVVAYFDEGRNYKEELKENERLKKNGNNVETETVDKITEHTNGHAKASTLEQTKNSSKSDSKIQPKFHHQKGKRTVHGSRKKK